MKIENRKQFSNPKAEFTEIDRSPMCRQQILRNNAGREECTISADTLRRLYLLNVIAGFARGTYGSKRLHKITYIAERKYNKLRPFEFKKYHYGQYSETLDEIKEQLISIGLVIAIPLDSSIRMTLKLPGDKRVEWLEGGIRYIVSDPDAIAFFKQAFRTILPDGMAVLRSAIRAFGYLPEQELLERCYAFPEFNEVEFQEAIFESNLPDRLEVPNLSEDECEELDMVLSPKFMSAMRRIIQGIDNSKLDLEKVKEIEIPIQISRT